ncbi:MAG: hypothetical protein IPK44_24195 [Candidatus Accumulibacter sp.]|uniref:hypothetical protein n=1 Tax=Accumulibacter sp. TaxID=2053492 RepID=UPI00258A6271|nr:hypothetical protein [Accumulibacter sp.]MBK8117391.1 hypothetical protein [Accumulibacter sp.]
MIVSPLRLNASRRNRRQTNHQWRSKRSEMQFRRHLAISYSNWRWSNRHIDSRSFRWRLFFASIASGADLRRASIGSGKIPANPAEIQQ